MADTDPLQRLVDIEAIKQLKARYFRLLDTKRWDEWGQVFAAGCVMEVPEADTEKLAVVVPAKPVTRSVPAWTVVMPV